MNLHVKNKLSASHRRVLFTKWVGNFWGKIKTLLKNTIMDSFLKCGVSNKIEWSMSNEQSEQSDDTSAMSNEQSDDTSVESEMSYDEGNTDENSSFENSYADYSSEDC